MEPIPKFVNYLSQIKCTTLREEAMTLLRKQHDGELSDEEIRRRIEVVCRSCTAFPGRLIYTPVNDKMWVIDGQNCQHPDQPPDVVEPHEGNFGGIW